MSKFSQEKDVRVANSKSDFLKISILIAILLVRIVVQYVPANKKLQAVINRFLSRFLKDIMLHHITCQKLSQPDHQKLSFLLAGTHCIHE